MKNNYIFPNRKKSSKKNDTDLYFLTNSFMSNKKIGHICSSIQSIEISYYFVSGKLLYIVRVCKKGK